MATAYEILVLALKDAGVIADGETPSADIAADAFTTLNHMLAMWQTDCLYVNAMVENAFTPDGSMTYTVGTGGTANFARPERINYAFWRSNNVDYPIAILNTFEEFEQIPQKTLSGQPDVIFYNPTTTLGTLYIYPQPADGSIRLVSVARFPTLSTSASTLTFPPDYMMVIRFSLAELLAATFNTPINDGIVELANRARKMLKRNNVRIPELTMQPLVRVRSNVFTG